MISHRKLRELFIEFWEGKEHKEITPASLVLQEDATTLFTSSGMQPLVPYLSGETHPDGNRLFDIQPCIRTQDIYEVGDNRHTTFFEMMGNWSLGDYFKKEQLRWKWEFFTDVLKLDKNKLYVTVFKGGHGVSKDEESEKIWKEIGVAADHISFYDANENWWSRSGPPDSMPTGEIGGPSSEVFYDFGTKHDIAFGKECHTNCGCGRFSEIGNSVFIQYRKNDRGELVELPQKNVDYGGGLERIFAVINSTPDIFKTDLFSEVLRSIEELTRKEYSVPDNQESMRVIADHIRASVFLIVNGVVPSNKEHGYILRRFLRRSSIKLYQLSGNIEIIKNLDTIAHAVVKTYEGIYMKESDTQLTSKIMSDETSRFTRTLEIGLREIKKQKTMNGKVAFDIFQSYGFPFELTQELATEQGIQVDIKQFQEEQKKHQELSRTASAGKFKGGLADHSDQVIKYHTATHLLHQALKDVFGKETRQEGSNITQERLRFDVKLDHKPSDGKVKKVEDIINQKVQERLPVNFKIMPRNEAERIGAASFFKEKYGDSVKVYYIGGSENDIQSAYSKEFCGGPHVKNTSEIGKIKLFKVKKIGANLVRLYVK